jgi:phosphatidylglycerol:prolipoprotein diacylglycerol transferase
MLAVFALLFYLHGKKKFDGQILILYGFIYSTFRFLVEFVRDDPRGDLFGFTSLTGLSTSQLIALIVAIGSGFFLYRRRTVKAEDTAATR